MLKYIRYLQILSLRAIQYAEVPISGITTINNVIISQHYNIIKQRNNPLFHAELLCIKDTAQYISGYNFVSIIAYITLEPCSMCYQAFKLSKTSQIYCLFFRNIKKKNRYIMDKINNKTSKAQVKLIINKTMRILKFFFRIRRKHQKMVKYVLC